jgi:hypothetical protein
MMSNIYNNIGHFDIFRILQLYFGIFRLISVDSKFAYKHVPCSTLTHSTNEDLLNIKRKGDPKSRTRSPTSDTTETRNPSVIQSFC